jgi:hypothetical protein
VRPIRGNAIAFWFCFGAMPSSLVLDWPNMTALGAWSVLTAFGLGLSIPTGGTDAAARRE